MPGPSIPVDPDYTTKAGQESTVDFLMRIIPNTVVGAFAEGPYSEGLFFATFSP